MEAIAMSSSALLQATYSSALRLGLSPIKPVEETYEEKIGKFKLVHKVIKLIPTQTYSYKDYVTFFYEDVLRSISTEPKFDEEAIHKHLIQKSMIALEKTGLKSRIDKLEELRKNKEPSSFIEQHDIVIDIMTELSSMLTDEEESGFYVGRYLDSSGFQLSYFAELMSGSQVYKKYLNVMEYELRLLKGFVGASLQRGAQAALKRYADRKRELIPLIDAYDVFRVASMSLKTYVEICNSNTIEQIFEPKSLNFNKLNIEEFSRLLGSYKCRLDYFDDKVIERKPELAASKIDFNQPINNMWKKLASVAMT